MHDSKSIQMMHWRLVNFGVYGVYLQVQFCKITSLDWEQTKF